MGRVALKTFGLFPVTGRFHVLCPVTGFHVSEVLFRGVPAGDPGRALDSAVGVDADERIRDESDREVASRIDGSSDHIVREIDDEALVLVTILRRLLGRHEAREHLPLERPPAQVRRRRSWRCKDGFKDCPRVRLAVGIGELEPAYKRRGALFRGGLQHPARRVLADQRARSWGGLTAHPALGLRKRSFAQGRTEN